MKFEVIKTRITAEICIVEAKNKKEAIDKATDLNPEDKSYNDSWGGNITAYKYDGDKKAIEPHDDNNSSYIGYAEIRKKQLEVNKNEK